MPVAMSSPRRLLALLLSTCLSGCATVSSLHAGKADAPLVYVGTRLDWYALQGGCCAEQRFGTAPPAYPAVDMPFSLLLDTLLLPFAVASVLGVSLGVSGGS